MAGYHAKKRLGQSFLISESTIRRIIDTIGPQPGQTIIEVGPGRGALTLPLVRSGAKVIAVEFDRDMIGYLKKLLKRFHNVEIINQDFLTFDPAKAGSGKFILVGNLPFNISSPVLKWAAERQSMIERAVVVVQEEVARRLCSSPPSKNWSPLAIFTQLYFSVTQRLTVAPDHFHPRPKVTSAVIELNPLPEVEVRHRVQFELLVRHSFRRRRKFLMNNLVPEVIPDSDTALALLAELKWPRNVRAEQLSTNQFIELTELLVKNGLV